MKSLMNFARTTRGSALITALLIGLMFIALLMTFAQWGPRRTREDIHRLGTQRALAAAESGVDEMMLTLRMPNLLPHGGVLGPLQTTLPTGSRVVSAQRNSLDVNIVTVRSEGYHDTPKGSFVDPVTNRPAQRAVVQAKIRLYNSGDYAASTPNQLTIEAGSDLSGGSVYSRNLKFNNKAGLTTRVGNAFYVDSIDPANSSSFVTFTNKPVQMSSALSLIYLSDQTEAYYRDKVTDESEQVLVGGSELSGPLKPPKTKKSGEPVYICNGNLDLGSPSQDLEVDGYLVVYTTGSVHIRGNIKLKDKKSWMAILSHGSITIAKDAPDDLTINGTFLTNGSFSSEAPNRAAGSKLTVNGGILAHEGISMTPVWGAAARTYGFQNSSNLAMLLPNFTELVEYRILQGKFHQ